MEQYTLIWITDEKYKLVGMKVFTSMQSLRDYKNHYLEGYKNSELSPVDKGGYIWFVEKSGD